MDRYVKFLRGTPTAYANALAAGRINNDTLYFVSDPLSTNGLLYLGEQLICGGSGNGEISFSDITDIKEIPEDIADESLLVYNAEEGKWEVRDFQIFLDDIPNIAETQIFEIEIDSSVDHESAIDDATASAVALNSGDICVLKEIFFEGDDRKIEHISYVYRAEDDVWVRLDGEYNAANIFFGEDLGELSTSGKSLTEVLLSVLEESTKAPGVDDESIVVDSNNNISLKNWGVQYYKYVAPTGENLTATYTLQIVDADNPWKENLEPRVCLEDGKLVLAWFEPNLSLESQLTALEEQIETIETTIGEIPADKTVVDLIEESKYDDSELAKSVSANADEIARLDAALKAAIENDGEGLDSIKELALWIEEHGADAAALTKAIEDLKTYVGTIPEESEAKTIVELIGALEERVKALEDKECYISSVDENNFTVVEGKLLLVEGRYLLDTDDKEKLDNLILGDNGLEVSGKVSVENVDGLEDWMADWATVNVPAPFITSVDENNFTVTEGKLILNSITQAQVEGLDTRFTTVEGQILSLDQTVNGYTNEENIFIPGLVQLIGDTTYLTENETTIMEMLKWHDI